MAEPILPDFTYESEHYRLLGWAQLDTERLTPQYATDFLEQFYTREWALATIVLPPGGGVLLLYERR